MHKSSRPCENSSPTQSTLKFQAYSRAEQKKSRKTALRATIQRVSARSARILLTDFCHQKRGVLRGTLRRPHIGEGVMSASDNDHVKVGETITLRKEEPVRLVAKNINVGGTISISDLIHRLSKAKPSNVQEIAASQLELMAGYHQVAIAESRRSFNWALIGAGAGLIFFMAAAWFALWTGNAVAAVIPAVSGAVVEVVAGIVFFLYGKTTVQLGDFHSRLETLQRYLLANSICEGLEGDERNKVRAELIREIARVTRDAWP